MQKTHKQMIVEQDDHAVMDLEIIDSAGNITTVNARAVNVKHDTGADILLTALPEEADGKISLITSGRITSGDTVERFPARLVTYHSCANIIDVDVKVSKKPYLDPSE